MGGIVLDSSLLIAAERGRYDLEAFFNRFEDKLFTISAITASEMLHGLERANIETKASRASFISALFDILPIASFGLPEARHHARVWAILASKGNLIGAHDLLIAATALSLDYSVATLNTKDFKRVPGLRLVKL